MTILECTRQDTKIPRISRRIPGNPSDISKDRVGILPFHTYDQSPTPPHIACPEEISLDTGSHCSPPELDLLKSPGGGRNEKSALGPDLEYFIHRRTLVLLVSNFLTTTSPGGPMSETAKGAKYHRNPLNLHSKSHFPTSSTNRGLPFRETRPGLAQIAVSGVSWTWTLDLGLDLGSMRIQGNQ